MLIITFCAYIFIFPLFDKIYRNEYELNLSNKNLIDAIDDLNHSKNEAEANEKKFSAIMGQSQDGIALLDLNGNYVYVNKACSKMTGYSEDELLDMNVLNFTPKDQLAAFVQDMAIDDGQLIQVRIRRKDGSEFPAEIIRSVIKINDKNMILSIVRDVRERVKSEEILNAQTRHLSVLAEATHVFASAGTDYELVLSRVSEIVARQMESGIIIHLLSEDRKWLEFAIAFDPDSENRRVLAEIFGIGRIHIESADPSAFVVRTGKSQLSVYLDMEKMRSHLTLDVWPAIMQLNPISSVNVPLLINDQAIGIMYLIRHMPNNRLFNEEDVVMAEDLADRAAMAIFNAKLFDKVQNELNDRIKAENALLESRKHIGNIINSAIDAIVSTDQNHNIVIFNEAAEKMFKCKISDALGLPLNNFIPDRYHAKHYGHVANLIKEPDSPLYRKKTHSMIGRRMDGEEFPAEASVSIVHTEKGETYTAILRDVTDRNKVEEDLQRVTSNLQAIMDATLETIIMVNQDFVIVATNKTFLDRLFLPLNKVLGFPYFSFVPDHLIKGRKDKLIKVFSTGQQAISEDVRNNLILEHNYYPVFEKGEVKFVVMYIRNVTDQKMAAEEIRLLNETLEKKVAERTIELADANKKLLDEAEIRKAVEINLKQSESSFKEAQKIAKMGSWEYNASTDKSWWSENNYPVFGFPVFGVEPSYQSMRSRIHPDDLEKADEAFSETKQWKNPLEIELKFQMPDGEIKWVLNKTVPVFENGQFVKLKGVHIDITEQKKHREELSNAKKLAEDANKSKSEFLANMSHEIRTPLNAIVGFSSILKEKLTGQSDYSEYLENIIQSSKVLLHLINDILDLSKVEAGRMVMDYQPVKISNLIKEIKAVFQMKAAEKGLPINILIDSAIPDNLITDEKYLRQILFNLIGNAVKFTHNGSIDIIVGYHNSHENESKVDLDFLIKDTGIGIPQDQLDSIFEPFVQATQKDRNLYGGTGLGLSITRRLVELLGGRITVVSEKNKGSVFNVKLFNIEIGSLQENQYVNQVSGNLLQRVRFNNSVILMAEDVPSNRQIIREYLEPLNITVVDTINGEDCIEVARKICPDLILMDMQMPVMDGYTAIQIIKSDDSLKDIPVIALTASGMNQHKKQFENVADDFLIKPIFKNDLLEKLIKYLPFESINDNGFSNDVAGSTNEWDQHSLPEEIKKLFVNKFLPEIINLQETLNVDEIISFVHQIEEFNKLHKNEDLKWYCSQLDDYIQSFNFDKILSTLKQFLVYMNS